MSISSLWNKILHLIKEFCRINNKQYWCNENKKYNIKSPFQTTLSPRMYLSRFLLFSRSITMLPYGQYEAEDPYLFEGDIKLTRGQYLSIFHGIHLFSAREGGNWPNGTVPYVFSFYSLLWMRKRMEQFHWASFCPPLHWTNVFHGKCWDIGP